MCLLGLSTGLAWSSHYKGLLLVPVLLAAPLLLTPPKRTLDYYKAVPISLAIALCTFLIINYPLFTDFDTFIKGFLYEKRHVLAGHKVKIDALVKQIAAKTGENIKVSRFIKFNLGESAT